MKGMVCGTKQASPVAVGSAFSFSDLGISMEQDVLLCAMETRQMLPFRHPAGVSFFSLG